MSKTSKFIDSNPWVTCPEPQPQADFRLLCFPYAGGKASIFLSWPDGLPSTIEVCSVQLPGRGSRFSEPAFTNLRALIKTMAAPLLPYLDKPFALFGHSLGALIAFELARHLRRDYDLKPIQLFVSGCRAPQLGRLHPPMSALPESELIATLRRLTGTPEPVLQNAELMQLLTPILRADFTLTETYVYTAEAPLDCPISAFGGREDMLVSQDSLEAWNEQTGQAFKLRMLPGDHFFLNTAQSSLLQAIDEAIRRLSAANPHHNLSEIGRNHE
jgi:medium-chain acyl-[acyl-carrier-protein] hydrolase